MEGGQKGALPLRWEKSSKRGDLDFKGLINRCYNSCERMVPPSEGERGGRRVREGGSKDTADHHNSPRRQGMYVPSY